MRCHAEKEVADQTCCLIELQYTDTWPPVLNRHVGLVVKASAWRRPSGFDSHLRWDFSGSSHTSDLKIDTPVATLSGAWRLRVSAGTCRPGVSIL